MPASSWSLSAALIAISWMSTSCAWLHPAAVVVGLEPLQPLRHRVGADHGRRQQRDAGRHRSAAHSVPHLRGHRDDVRAVAVRERARTGRRSPCGGRRAPAAGRSPSSRPSRRTCPGRGSRCGSLPTSVTNRSWQTSLPSGCSSGRVSTKLATAPLLTCIRMSPPDSSSGRSISPLTTGRSRRGRGRRAARSAPPAGGRPDLPPELDRGVRRRRRGRHRVGQQAGPSRSSLRISAGQLAGVGRDRGGRSPRPRAAGRPGSRRR